MIILKSDLMTGQVFGYDAFQQPYSNITGVQVKFSLLTGYFELSAGGMQNSPKQFWSSNNNTDPAKAPNCISLNSKHQAQRFRAACSFILERIDQIRQSNSRPISGQTVSVNSPSREDILATLEKLGQLRDAGVLTDEEFEKKKAELLSRI